MEEKITTSEEYNLCLQHKKQIRDKMFNLKLEIFMNQKDLEKSKLLKEEYKTLKRNYTLLSFKICEYEIENNIEEKKEGKKK